MTPAARIQSSIELLESILAAWQEAKRIPADKLIDRYFKSRRYIGSKDRASVGELVYWCLRHLSLLQWQTENGTPRLLVLFALLTRNDYTPDELHSLCDGSKFAPLPLSKEEVTQLKSNKQHPPEHVRLNYPEWMEEELKQRFGNEMEIELAALNEQAPMDIRTNTLKTSREKLLHTLLQEGFEVEPLATPPDAIRMKKRAPIFTSPLFRAGHFEVQDAGSQMLAALVDAQPGMKVIDFCAGAGGKTLAIAAQMKNKGRLLAWDISEKRLSQMKERLKRAGVDNVQMHVLDSEQDGFVKRHKQSADRVLVDAPCTGTGTWRRNPDLKWRTTRNDLEEMTRLQASILQSAARLVKPGGRLIYATCSFLSHENEKQVECFLENNPHFKVVSAQKMWDKNNDDKHISATLNPDDVCLSLTPHQDGVDGFFAGIFERCR